MGDTTPTTTIHTLTMAATRIAVLVKVGKGETICCSRLPTRSDQLLSSWMFHQLSLTNIVAFFFLLSSSEPESDDYYDDYSPPMNGMSKSTMSGGKMNSGSSGKMGGYEDYDDYYSPSKGMSKSMMGGKMGSYDDYYGYYSPSSKGMNKMTGGKMEGPSSSKGMSKSKGMSGGKMTMMGKSGKGLPYDDYEGSDDMCCTQWMVSDNTATRLEW